MTRRRNYTRESNIEAVQLLESRAKKQIEIADEWNWNGSKKVTGLD